MNRLTLLKKMLPGLLPILIFIIADELWGTRIGLIVAIILGVLQLVFFAIKDKKLEKFVLIDTLLILFMGGISIALNNDIFFKLKPAIIEAILVAVLAYSVFGKNNIMLSMSKRYMQDVEINDQQNLVMQKSLKNLLILMSLHLILLLYSCFWMSTEAWAFISTALFYIILAGYFGIELLVRLIKNKRNPIEYLPIIDEQGNFIGKASREECHHNPKLLYPVVRLYLFNKEGKILLQRRSEKSDIEAGKWDASVAGHVQYGENLEEALKRECLEEINYTIDKFDLVHSWLYNSPQSRSMMFVYIGVIDHKPTANIKEVEEVDFFYLKEITPLIIKGKASSGLAKEFPILRDIVIKSKKI